MAKLTDSAGGATIGSGETSQIVMLTAIDYVTVSFFGDLSSATLTAQVRQGRNGTWTTFTYGGTDQTWNNTTLGAATDMDQSTYILGSCELRFSCSASGTPSVAIHVDGKYVTPLAIA